MGESELQIRCQRCGNQMDLVDPAAGQPWPPVQYWSCVGCGRHFWTSYVTAPGTAPAKPAPPAAAAKPPASAPAAALAATAAAAPDPHIPPPEAPAAS